MAAPLTAVLDACVLYPFHVRNVLVDLAAAGLFRARWSPQIHDEWTAAVRRTRPGVSEAQLRRTRELMDAHALDALVTGHEPLIESLTLPDPADRHVLAAAIHAGADTIVTHNLRHFPADRLEPHAIQAVSPDAFVSDLLAQDRAAVVLSIARCRRRCVSPPYQPGPYLDVLRANGLRTTVDRLGDALQTL